MNTFFAHISLVSIQSIVQWQKFLCALLSCLAFSRLIEQREQHTHTCKITAIAHKIRNMNIKCIVSRVKSIYRTSLINVCYMHTYTLHMHTNCMRRTTNARASPRQLNCTMAKKLKQSHTRHVICYRAQTVSMHYTIQYASESCLQFNRTPMYTMQHIHLLSICSSSNIHVIHSCRQFTMNFVCPAFCV